MLSIACVNNINATNIYIININDNMFNQDRIKVFLHECVHISQINQKRLIVRKTFVWYEEVTYRSDSKYENRKYEINADELTNMLYWKYREIRKIRF